MTAPPINKPRPPAQARTTVSIPVTFTRKRRLAEMWMGGSAYIWLADDAHGDHVEEVMVSGTIIDWAHYTVHDPQWGNHGWTEAIVLTEGKLLKVLLGNLTVTE